MSGATERRGERGPRPERGLPVDTPFHARDTADDLQPEDAPEPEPDEQEAHGDPVEGDPR